MNDNQFTSGMFGTLLTTIGASLSVTELQAIISIVVTVLGFLITVITTVIIPGVKKWREIRRDGRVTNEELEELQDTLTDGLNELKKQGKEGK